MAKRRLLIVGNSCMEFIMKVKRAPERGEHVFSNLAHSLVPGGLGVISAVTASRLGSDSILCTRVGEDENGAKLRQVFIENGIDTRFVITDKRKPTGLNAITLEDRSKARTITYLGANSAICYDDLEEAFMSYPDAFLINMDMRDDITLEAARFAESVHVPIIVSVGSEHSGFDITDLPPIEIFSPNREQTLKFTGIDPVDTTSSLHACVKIINMIKTKYVVLKLGERGVFAFDGVYSKIYPALENEVIDTTSAGAIFTAALAHFYLENGDVFKAAEMANAVASLSVSTEGAFTSIPTQNLLKTLF